jgi:hypothetical protein
MIRGSHNFKRVVLAQKKNQKEIVLFLHTATTHATKRMMFVKTLPLFLLVVLATESSISSVDAKAPLSSSSSSALRIPSIRGGRILQEPELMVENSAENAPETAPFVTTTNGVDENDGEVNDGEVHVLGEEIDGEEEKDTIEERDDEEKDDIEEVDDSAQSSSSQSSKDGKSHDGHSPDGHSHDDHLSGRSGTVIAPSIRTCSSRKCKP